MSRHLSQHKTIPLSQGQYALVDEQDFEYLNQWKWCAMWNPVSRGYYAVRGDKVNGKTKLYRMNRVIMKAAQDSVVDHINHDTLDNRRDNLRVCKQSENMKNHRKRRDNTTGYKGVSRVGSKFQVQIRVNSIRKYLGRFSNLEEAARVYDKAAKMYHGQFALTNF